MKTYIIAEAGVNHNGNVDIALKLIDEAKKAGAHCIKFQTFKASQIVTAKSPKAAYQLEVTDKTESQYEMLKKLELDFNSYQFLIESCKKLGIDFMSTPYNKEDADFLADLEVEAFKIASGQLTEIPFLKYVAAKQKRMIISAGMATLSDVFNAVEAIRSVGNNDIVVLQCTTNYPSKIEDANLLTIPVIKSSCNVRVGYSDHVQNNIACFVSIALGAEIVEKHFTLDKKMEGPDHSSSLTPIEFAELVNGIKDVELSLGNGLKLPTEAEKKNSFGMKRSLVANSDLKAGMILEEKHLGFKRPSNGLSINYLDTIIGKKLIQDISMDEPLQYFHIQW
jgi:N-acetylneuraminate synthase/N,N'-diacetyllegionaminate synthase